MSVCRHKLNTFLCCGPFTWGLQFTLAAGEVVQAEVHEQDMTEICRDGSNAKEPPQALVKVLGWCAGATVTHQRLNSCYLDNREGSRKKISSFGFVLTGEAGTVQRSTTRVKKTNNKTSPNMSTHPAWYHDSFDHPWQSQVIETQHTALSLLQAHQQSRPGRIKKQKTLISTAFSQLEK